MSLSMICIVSSEGIMQKFMNCFAVGLPVLAPVRFLIFLDLKDLPAYIDFNFNSRKEYAGLILYQE